MSTLAEVERSDLWFDGGDIIIQAGLKQFRVYKGILAHWSPVFHDMFSVPQPTTPAGAEAAFLHMPTDDDPEGVEHVMKALHIRSHLSPPTEHKLADIVSMLSVAIKYDINQLVREAIILLSAVFPMEYEDWTESIVADRYAGVTDLESALSIKKFIILAQSNSDSALYALLPAAYLRLSFHLTLTDASIAGLPEDVFRNFILGRVRVMHHFASCLTTLRSSGCEDIDCLSVAWDFINRQMSPDALAGVIVLVKMAHGKLEDSIGRHYIADSRGAVTLLCSKCGEKAAIAILERRRSMWKKLPALFSVADGWPELQIQRNKEVHKAKRTPRIELVPGPEPEVAAKPALRIFVTDFKF